METNTEFDNLTAFTGSYPFGSAQDKPGKDGQNDPDACPRCGASRALILQRAIQGEAVVIDCQECRLEVFRRIRRYQEIKER
jgi:hypothetical protein